MWSVSFIVLKLCTFINFYNFGSIQKYIGNRVKNVCKSILDRNPLSDYGHGCTVHYEYTSYISTPFCSPNDSGDFSKINRVRLIIIYYYINVHCTRTFLVLKRNAKLIVPVWTETLTIIHNGRCAFGVDLNRKQKITARGAHVQTAVLAPHRLTVLSSAHAGSSCAVFTDTTL